MNLLEAPALVLFYGVVCVSLLLPGLALVATLSLRLQMETGLATTTIVLGSCGAGYAAFWIYFFSKTAGQICSYGLIAISLIALLYLVSSRVDSRVALRAIAFPFGYAAIAGLFACSLLFLFGDPFRAGVDLANTRFFAEVRPGDNLIPLFLGQKIYDREPLRPFCCGDWLSSDRPPLQAGIFLLERPLRLLGNTGLQYQVLGTILQSLWVCGVWVLLNRLGLKQKESRRVLVLLTCSSFVFYNSVYVWPKLLAAALLLFLFAVLVAFDRRDCGLAWTETIVAAAAFALAMMAHPGSVFSLPGFVVAGWTRLQRTQIRRLAVALIVVAVVVCPWMAYQKFVDPPGNRLPKMHLAGVAAIDSRSIGEALIDEYGRLDFRTLIGNKWSNVRQLIGPAPLQWLPSLSVNGKREWTRIAQREYISDTLGVINFGWIALIILWSRRKQIEESTRFLFGAAGINLLLWCLALFGPSQAVVTHSSFADVLLLFLGLSLCLLEAFPSIALLIAALELFGLVVIWAAYVPALMPLSNGGAAAPHLEVPMLVLAVCTGSAVGIAWFWGNVRSRTKRAKRARNHTRTPESIK